MKRAWNGFYPHGKGELGIAEAMVLGEDMAAGDMEPCFALCWQLLEPTR